MRISDWSSDVCSSDLRGSGFEHDLRQRVPGATGAALSLPLVEVRAAFAADVGGPGLGHAWIPDLGSEQDSRQRSRGTRRHAYRFYRTTTSANEVAWTSLAGVAVGAVQRSAVGAADVAFRGRFLRLRSEEHTSELQSLMRISYAVFC